MPARRARAMTVDGSKMLLAPPPNPFVSALVLQVVEVVEVIAGIKGLDVAEVAAATYYNTRHVLFGQQGFTP